LVGWQRQRGLDDDQIRGLIRVQRHKERDGRLLIDTHNFDVREVVRARHDLSVRLGDFDFTVLVDAKVILQIIAQLIYVFLHFTPLVLGHFRKAAEHCVILVAILCLCRLRKVFRNRLDGIFRLRLNRVCTRAKRHVIAQATARQTIIVVRDSVAAHRFGWNVIAAALDWILRNGLDGTLRDGLNRVIRHRLDGVFGHGLNRVLGLRFDGILGHGFNRVGRVGLLDRIFWYGLDWIFWLGLDRILGLRFDRVFRL